ncbi:MAG: ATP-binding protein [Candidatus Sericytochromatia bacterium]
MSTAPLDFSECEREVLDRTGRTQSQGALLVVEWPSGETVACSDNWNSLTGVQLQRLNAPFALSQLLDLSQMPPEPATQTHVLPPAPSLSERPPFQLLGSRQGKRLLIEWLPLSSDAAGLDLRPVYLPVTSRPNFYESAQQLADQLRQQLGLDRVMIYQFDPEQAGDVIAEARRSDWEPYLGLHYPASDIPQVARALYLRNRTRIIHDAYSPSVPLLQRAGVSADSLDLTPVSIRSVSPYHLEYLRNMGVRATVSTAILHGERLWGLIACHHSQPISWPLAASTYLETASSAFSQVIAAVEQQQQAQQVRLFEETRLALRQTLQNQPELSDAQILEQLLMGPYSLSALTQSQAAVLYTQGSLSGSGNHPDLAWVQAFVDFLLTETDGHFASSHLVADCPIPLPPGETWSGLMAQVIHREPCIVALVFRHQHLKEVHWGGDPSTPALRQDNAKLSPRRSFHLWKETVLDQSQPWLFQDQQLFQILTEMLQESFAGAELSGRLQRGSRALTAQIVAHAYIAGAVTSGLQNGIVMTMVESQDQPATLLQLNQNIQELFALGSSQWQAGEAVSHFLSRLGLIQNQTLHLNTLPERLNIWSPMLGHRTLKISRRALLSIEQRHERHAVVTVQFFDITGEDRLNEALGAAVQRAEAANATKLRFLANTSHELKTPLHAVLGFHELLEQELAEHPHLGELKLYADQIGLAGRHMLNLVEQLLFFARTAREGLRLPVQNTELTSLLQETLAWQTLSAQQKKIALSLDLGPPLQAQVNPQTIQQLVVNLLSNAIKFSEAGAQVSCRLHHDTLSQQAILEVQDTGMGMNAEEVARACEAFFRGERQQSGKWEGSGIGLSLVKAITEAHGGRLEITSTRDVGTQVTVSLPLTQNTLEIELKMDTPSP